MFLLEYGLGKGLDHMLGFDGQTKAEVTEHLNALRYETQKIANQMQSLEKRTAKLETDVNKLKEVNVRRESLYREQSTRLAIGQRLDSWRRYEQLMTDLQQIPQFLEKRDKAALASLYYRVSEFQAVDPETEFVTGVTDLLLAHDSVLRDIKTDLAAIHEKDKEQDRAIAAIQQHLAEQDEERVRNDNQIRDKQALILAQQNRSMILVAVERASWQHDQLAFFEPLRAALTACNPGVIVFRPEVATGDGIEPDARIRYDVTCAATDAPNMPSVGTCGWTMTVFNSRGQRVASPNHDSAVIDSDIAAAYQSLRIEFSKQVPTELCSILERTRENAK